MSVFTGVGRPTEVEGLSTFDKKVILFGSEGNAKVFASKYKQDAFDPQLWKKTNMPHAVVEVVDPITLGAKLVDVRDKRSCCCEDDFDIASVPESVCRVFDDSLVLGGEAKRVFVSIGIFSIIKLERKVQLLIPSYDFCIPQKECVGATDDIAYTQYWYKSFLCLIILLIFLIELSKVQKQNGRNYRKRFMGPNGGKAYPRGT